MGRMVRCTFCQQLVDKDLCIRHNEKNYHQKCYQDYLDRKEVLRYVAKLFGFKSEDRPGPVINSQLKTFMTKYSYYTYKGILNSLVYFYEVKKGSKEKANEGIGIVPYIYDEAQEYYEKLYNKQEKVAKIIEKQLEESPVVLKVKKIENKKVKNLYDLNNL